VSTVAHPAAETRRAAVTAALLSEVGLARIALGVGALHVVDDNFLQPQPGTSAGDHLWGGLVQLALFVLFAWAYPRLRAGARATLAILVGAFVGAMAGEAINEYRDGSLSGDDYTGLLCLPAGLLLVGVGLATFWRTRKGGAVLWRYTRRVLSALGILLGLYFVVYPLAESYVITHAGRAFVPPENLGAAYEDVTFTTGDGLKLVGWYVPSKNGAAVISFPGRKSLRSPRGCSRSTATACSSSIAAARARARATRTSSAGRAPATSRRRWRISSRGRTSRTAGSAVSASRSAER
jgi:hypothetical protein